MLLFIAVLVAAIVAVATPRHRTGVSTSVQSPEGYDFSYHTGLKEHHEKWCSCSSVIMTEEEREILLKGFLLQVAYDRRIAGK